MIWVTEEKGCLILNDLLMQVEGSEKYGAVQSWIEREKNPD